MKIVHLTVMGLVLTAACKDDNSKATDAAGKDATLADGSASDLAVADAAIADATADGTASADTVSDPRPPAPDTAPFNPSDARLPGNSPYIYIGGSTEIRTYQLDLTNGVLAQRQNLVGTGSMFMTSDRANKYVYSVHNLRTDGGQTGGITSYAVDKSSGALMLVNTAIVPTNPVHVSMDPSGKWLFTAFFFANLVMVSPVQSSGGVGAMTDSKTTPVQAHSANVDASGKFLFVPCRDGEAVVQYVIDATQGKLALNTPPQITVPAKTGPRHMDIHPNQRWAYVANETGGSVTLYSFDRTVGTLTSVETLSTVPDGFKEDAVAHVAVHPTGRFLYVSNRRHESLSVYAINETTGKLTLVEHEQDGRIAFPRHFAIEASGKYLMMASQLGNSVTVFEINTTDGRLTFKSLEPSVRAPIAVLSLQL